MDKFYLEKAKEILLAKKQNAEIINDIALAELSNYDEYKTLLEKKKQLIKDLSSAGNSRYQVLTTLKNIELEIDKLAADKNVKLRNYNCANCNDSGIDSNGNKCQCLINLYYDVIKELTVGNDIKNFTFADSQLPECKQKNGISALYLKLEKYCGEFPNNTKKLMFISGGVGVGKSYMISAMANALIAKGMSVNYLSSFNLSNLLAAHHSNNLKDNGTALQSILNCQALFIDDLGCEPIYRNVTAEYLYNILEYRENKHTFITSNLDPSSTDIKVRYGERVFSRLMNQSKCVVIKIDGEDLRFK